MSEEKFYFVRETRNTLDSEERRAKEHQKVACGREHFSTRGVDYDRNVACRSVDVVFVHRGKPK